jgi:hypothetical protein
VHKRRWVFVAVALLLTVGVLRFWSRHGRDVVLDIIFVGYTNEVASSLSGMPEIPGVRVGPLPPAQTALLRATNKGSFPLKVNAGYQAGSAATPGFVRPSGGLLPRVLKPGESVLVYVTVDPGTGPWWTEYMCERHGSRDRFYNWVWNRASGSRAAQSFLSHVMPANLVFVKCGPVTNQPAHTFPIPVKLTNPPLEDLRF